MFVGLLAIYTVVVALIMFPLAGVLFWESYQAAKKARQLKKSGLSPEIQA